MIRGMERGLIKAARSTELQRPSTHLITESLSRDQSRLKLESIIQFGRNALSIIAVPSLRLNIKRHVTCFYLYSAFVICYIKCSLSFDFPPFVKIWQPLTQSIKSNSNKDKGIFLTAVKAISYSKHTGLELFPHLDTVCVCIWSNLLSQDSG